MSRLYTNFGLKKLLKEKRLRDQSRNGECVLMSFVTQVKRELANAQCQITELRKKLGDLKKPSFVSPLEEKRNEIIQAGFQEVLQVLTDYEIIRSHLDTSSSVLALLLIPSIDHKTVIMYGRDCRTNKIMKSQMDCIS